VIEETEITEAEIRAEQQALASQKGITVKKLYSRMARGDYHGTILESRLHMLRFMLGEDV
jgi:hypothetical protein